MPQLADPNFEKAVVLMIEHSETGSMGLIINQEASITFDELAKSQELKVAPGRERDALFIGGPVEQHRGFVLHDCAEVEERLTVLPGLFLSVTTDALPGLLANPTVRLRFCLGYSGWGPGQVERELSEGAWLFTEATRASVLLEEPKKVWAAVIEGMGLSPGWIVPGGGVN